MKKFTLILFLISISLLATARGTDSISVVNQINILSKEISFLKEQNAQLSSRNAQLDKRVRILEKQLGDVNVAIDKGKQKSQNLEQDINQNKQEIKSTAENFDIRISETKNDVSAQSKQLKNKSLIGLLIALLVFAVSVILSWLLHKKGSSEIKRLKARADSLNEEIVEKLSNEANEMQKVAYVITTSSQSTSSDSERQLILTLADRITFMEMTLYRMDNSVRGYKQLAKSIKQMKDNLLANGYEIVEMLGKQYHDGMIVNANFLEDDSLAQGQQIITAITKPQINYQGKMIQSAQITVSQNI